MTKWDDVQISLRKRLSKRGLYRVFVDVIAQCEEFPVVHGCEDRARKSAVRKIVCNIGTREELTGEIFASTNRERYRLEYIAEG